MNYILKKDFVINSGFVCNSLDVYNAVNKTNDVVAELPTSLFKSINFKTTSSLVGSVFAEELAKTTGAIVNPIEKGHPDIIPKEGINASEQALRNYHQGIEIKVTIGNVLQGKKLCAGDNRIEFLTGITWQAHHREVASLMGLIWDFLEYKDKKIPIITGIFFSNELNEDDWGQISGITGRNTKVTGMNSLGRQKMGNGWILVLNEQIYLSKYKNLLLGSKNSLVFSP